MSIAELAAYVCSHLKENGIEVVLSGGSCVSIYTENKYETPDFDFIENVSSGRKKLTVVLAKIGFAPDPEKKNDKYFHHAETDFLIEFPSGPLALGDEPPHDVQTLEFETGKLTILSPTDCIKDRLLSYFYWEDLQCLNQAIMVARDNKIEFQELERWARKEGQVMGYQQFLDKLSGAVQNPEN